MSPRDIQKRLETMEQEAAKAAEQAYTTWIQTLSDTELDALLAAIDPAERAEMEALSESELEHRIATTHMSAREWETSLREGKERLAAFHASQERINATP